jgi:hypothetical protein
MRRDNVSFYATVTAEMATRYAKAIEPNVQQVKVVRWTCALDNYEPIPRRTADGLAVQYIDTNGRACMWFPETMDMQAGERCMFIVDDGYTAVPHYKAAWSHEPKHETNGGLDVPYSILQAMPVNHVRPDGRQADYWDWMLGPRTCYHLKVKDW